MLDDPNQPPLNALLTKIKPLGEARKMVEKLFDMIGQSKFFIDFTHDDVELLAGFMQMYQASPGEMIIQEGDVDDYMLFLVEGRVNIVKSDSQGEVRPMSVVGPGSTLGEMSMIDGEPRFATCIAIDTTTFAVLSREKMVKIIMEEPALGSKILIKLVTLLSQRLRSTSSDLLHHLERSEAV